MSAKTLYLVGSLAFVIGGLVGNYPLAVTDTVNASADAPTLREDRNLGQGRA